MVDQPLYISIWLQFHTSTAPRLPLRMPLCQHCMLMHIGSSTATKVNADTLTNPSPGSCNALGADMPASIPTSFLVLSIAGCITLQLQLLNLETSLLLSSQWLELLPDSHSVR